MDNLLGLLLLEDFTLVSSTHPDSFNLRFDSTNTQYAFRLESENDAKSWMNAINNASIEKTRSIIKKLYSSLKKNPRKSSSDSNTSVPSSISSPTLSAVPSMVPKSRLSTRLSTLSDSFANLSIDTSDKLVMFSCKLNLELIEALIRPSRSFLNFSTPDLSLRILVKQRKNDSEWIIVHGTEWEEYQSSDYVEFLVPMSISTKEKMDFCFDLVSITAGLIGSVECTSNQLFRSIFTNSLFIINLFNPSLQKIIAELHLHLLKFPESKLKNVDNGMNVLRQQFYVAPSTNHSYVFISEIMEIPSEIVRCVPGALAKALLEYESSNLRSVLEMEIDENLMDSESLNVIRTRLISFYAELAKHYQHFLSLDFPDFRKSVEKKDLNLQWVALNCILQKFKVASFEAFDELDIVTFGAPAAHAMGFSNSPKDAGISWTTDSEDFRYIDRCNDDLTRLSVEVNEAFDEFYDWMRSILDLPPHSDSITIKLNELQFRFSFVMQQSHLTLQKCSSIIKTAALTSSTNGDIFQKAERIRERISSTSFPRFSKNYVEFTNFFSNRKLKLDTQNADTFVEFDHSEVIKDAQYLLESLLKYLDIAKVIMGQQNLVSRFKVFNQTDTQSVLVERKRRDACFSQILSAFCVGFVAMVNRFYTVATVQSIPSRHDSELWPIRNWIFWDCLYKVGYLAGFESLLSSFGEERGMLVDMRNAVQELRSLKIVLKGESDQEECVRISGSRHNLILSLRLSNQVYETIPHEFRDHEITVHSVLFSRGINEQQVLARWKGDNSLELQINRDSTLYLGTIIERWKRWLQNQCDGMFIWPVALVNSIVEIYDDLQAAVGLTQSFSASSSIEEKLLAGSKSRWNETTVLLLSSKIIRSLATTFPDFVPEGAYSGSSAHVEIIKRRSNSSRSLRDRALYPTTPFSSRFTSCKSAKDRTAMSSTLEQCLFVSFDYASYQPSDASTGSFMGSFTDSQISSDENDFPLLKQELCIHSSAFQKLLNSMRGEEGCRIVNIEMNLSLGEFATNGKGRGEHGKYAFHPLQVSMFPPLYRPPIRCVQSNMAA